MPVGSSMSYTQNNEWSKQNCFLKLLSVPEPLKIDAGKIHIYLPCFWVNNKFVVVVINKILRFTHEAKK